MRNILNVKELTSSTIEQRTISSLPIGLLRANPKNPRAHDQKQIQQIARSIANFGFNVPVLIDNENNIIAGHGRVLACQKLGWQEVPVIRLEHLTESQAQAFTIADNRLTEISVWDDRLLAEQLQQLSELDLTFDIEATGFSLDEIEMRVEGLISSDNEPDCAENIPEISEVAVSRMGDLWQLGRHRLLCGDATKMSDVERLLNGKRPGMTVTDPPYNVAYGNSAKDKLHGRARPILNDDLGDDFENFLSAACDNIVKVTNGAIYIFMSSSALHLLQKVFIKAGGHWSTFIIWAKQAFTIGRSDFQRMYEPILYGWREGAQRYWCGARDQGDVWHYDKPNRNDAHPTMKPVPLIMRAIRNSSERDAVVFDPFLGSGTTLIAAECTGRVCYGIELDPKYVDVCIRRWQEHTCEYAVHAGTGKRFDEMKPELEDDHDDQ